MRLMRLSEIEMNMGLFPWWCGGCRFVFALPYWSLRKFADANEKTAR
jgi:hypothetical protein